MIKSYTGLTDFVAKVRDGMSVARSDRFEVTFNFPAAVASSDLFEYGAAYRATVMCEELQLPGLSATNLPVKIGPWTEFRNQNVEFLTQDSVFTFVENQNLQVRKLFEKWIDATVNRTTKEVAFHEDVTGSILINVLDRQDNIRAQYQLFETVPKLISLTPMSWGNTGIMRLSVSFAAKYWERIYDEVTTSPKDDLRDRIKSEYKPGPDVVGIPGFDPISRGE